MTASVIQRDFSLRPSERELSIPFIWLLIERLVSCLFLLQSVQALESNSHQNTHAQSRPLPVRMTCMHYLTWPLRANNCRFSLIVMRFKGERQHTGRVLDT